ncbi:uncharacterized protein LOC132723964 [Ruditapes philippinarum]|uniref:uncharacterized protein LOC132723964 n=1 Tax=Ruditapes philippinarum TaxID=129788 RepID=UPI00295B29CC|nr:uncharacterized protein LOC132723964 [Ruditapes philippinarum]
MENIAATFEMMVNSFTDAEELMNFAATWGIQDSPGVRFRLFQLRNPQYGDDFVNEQMERLLDSLNDTMQNREDTENFDLALEYVREQEEIEGAVRALLFDEEMDKMATACVEDGEWSPQSPGLQVGSGDEPQAGPSHRPDAPRELQYTISKKSERTYAKNAAMDRTYQVKIDEQYNGQRLQDVRQGLHQMFEDVLEEARGNLAGNDLGRVVIHHQGLHDPIIVPLQPWDQLTANKVMEIIEKVLNSNQNLSIDESFYISIGTIELPKGSGGPRRRITKLKGKNNSLKLKTSIVTIDNEDQLCMARAIGVSWAKLNRCTPEEWKEIAKTRQKKSNLQLILENQQVPNSYYQKLTEKKRDEQRQLAIALSQLAGVSMDRPASLNDVEAFEEVLGVRVMVVSARLGNKFITSPSTDKRPCIYLYLVDDDHFHAITSITGFFSAMYFCDQCLYHYNNRERHQCETSCIVCKTDDCPETDSTVKCDNCNMTCRSEKCYNQHKTVPVHKKGKCKGKPNGLSQCQKYWKCPTCYKVIRTDKRKKEDHECGEYLCNSCEQYVMEGHLCYLRSIPAKEHYNSKFIFFDFECCQDEVSECENGYVASRKRNCKDCQSHEVCKSCSKCQHCKSSWCGKATHRPNFVVAHTVCPKCIDKTLTPESICKKCGTRCDECDNSELHDNEDPGPCPGKCGFREVTFEGADTAEKFGEWLFSPQHEYFKVFAHNMKGYDGYFLLEYLIDQSMRPDKIIYSGSKIMYMTIESDLHIKVIDSLNFLPMKLSALPKAFGLTELKKGWFPHYFNTSENQNYVGPYPDAQCYGHDFMSEKERAELLVWLSERKDDVFDFRKEMLDYCRSDVDILRQACLKFRELLMSATGERIEVVNEKGKKEKTWVGAVDPFDSVTIASVCMNVFRTKFLEEEWKVKLEGRDDWIPSKLIDGKLYVLRENEWILKTKLTGEKVSETEFVRTPIAKIPPNGYNDQYSEASIQWLEWVAYTKNVKIQHALNKGEKSLLGTRYKLDGYCEETNTAYEYHGCIFHGCPDCFADNREETRHPLTNQSLDELYALTMKKKAYIQQLGMKYVCIWDHEFKKQKIQNTELKQFVESLDIIDRLDPRESFFGGRTNASQLYYKGEEQEEIKYVDFTSLYPWVNKYCQYPVGHPTIITKDVKDIEGYFGIAKVKILPPRGLYHPVLPYRSNNKLKFPLCRTCADTENQNPCACSEQERELTGTWCTPEIQTAVKLGYQIKKIYEVYHWEESTQYDPKTGSGGLFANYINTFLKFKQEASGSPDWIHNEQDMTNYVSQYLQKEGVSLDRANISKNPV